jgi:hypothetical protein
MAKQKQTQFGAQRPSYQFIMNPYPDLRIARCPLCERATGQRKVPLLIHIDPKQLLALNYTCRYCKGCDLLVAHKHEIEHHLTEMIRQIDPTMLGNDYLIMGTVEKAAWRRGLTTPLSVAEMIEHTSDFYRYLEELRVTRPGWYKAGVEPPVAEPPPSQEWVKQGSG